MLLAQTRRMVFRNFLMSNKSLLQLIVAATAADGNIVVRESPRESIYFLLTLNQTLI
eukprot:SAG31_NODE_131_length_23419_cov_38.760087_12_plen_57_part_00